MIPVVATEEALRAVDWMKDDETRGGSNQLPKMRAAGCYAGDIPWMVRGKCQALYSSSVMSSEMAGPN